MSGQNVAYVVAGMILLAWGLGFPRWAGELAAIAAVAAYVLAVGWQPSVVRAGVAGALASLAWLASRPRDRWYFLLVGAAVLLAWNPYSLLEPGFQLSFAAVAAIFVLVPRLERRLEGYPLPRRLAQVVAVSGSCGAATAPIVWLHFGAIPVYSVPANALAAPVVAPLLGLALIATAVAPVLPGAAAALAWANGWLAAYLAACARFVGGLPYAEATSGTALALLAAVALLLALAVRLRPPRGPRVAALAAMGLVLVVAWRSAPNDAPPPPHGLRITVLDVGQGDAVLLQVPEGAVLVDQGPPEADVAERSAGSESGACSPSSSRIRSATTSAAPPRCCGDSKSASSSTRGFRCRAWTSGRPLPRPAANRCRSSRPARVPPTVPGACACASSGPTSPARARRTRTTTRWCCSRPTEGRMRS